MTIQRELLAKRYGKFDLKKKKKETSNSYFDWLFNADPEHISALNVQRDDVLWIFKIFKFDHGKSRVYNSDVPPELYSRHGGKMIWNWIYSQRGTNAEITFSPKKNIIIFINFRECLPCECTLGRLALGFNYNVMQSPADWTIKQLRKWEWELLQEGFKRQQGHTRICISPTLFIFSWDFSPTTPTDQIRMLVWEKRGRILRGRGGMEKVRMKAFSPVGSAEHTLNCSHVMTVTHTHCTHSHHAVSFPKIMKETSDSWNMVDHKVYNLMHKQSH